MKIRFFVGLDFIIIEISVVFLSLLTGFHVISMKFSVNYRYFISRKRESPKTGQDDRNREK